MLSITLAPAEHRRPDPQYLKGQAAPPCHCNTLVKSPIQGASEYPVMYCIEDYCHRIYVAVPIEQFREFVRVSWDRHKQLYLPQLAESVKNVLPFRRQK